MTKLKTFREHLKLTQAQMADRLGVTQSTLSRLENGEIKNPSISLAHRVEVETGGAVPMSFWTAAAMKSAAKRARRKGAQKDNTQSNKPNGVAA